jgi:hypothetical protein
VGPSAPITVNIPDGTLSPTFIDITASLCCR